MAADLTGDGWPDLFIANDGAANHLWVNQKDGTFKEEAARRGCAVNAMGKAEANMGIGLGDVDGDGLQDLFVTHLDKETNTVWRQVSPGYFRDWTTSSAMHRPAWKATGFGTALADFDLDGWPDAVIVNGRVVRQEEKPGSRLGPFWSRYGDRNQVFANDGTGRFRDVSAASPTLSGYDNVGRGLAVGDLGNDGSLALVVTAIGDRARVLGNVAPKRGNWLGVRALTAGGQRDALGAEVSVFAGAKRSVRLAHTGGSFLCSNDPRAHFGLGGADRVDRVEVRWPDGSRERFPGATAGQYLTLIQGKGQALP